jgi:hypothetical protein
LVAELPAPTSSPLGKVADKSEPTTMVDSPQPLSIDEALEFGDDEPLSEYLFEPNGDHADASLKPSSDSAASSTD